MKKISIKYYLKFVKKNFIIDGIINFLSLFNVINSAYPLNFKKKNKLKFVNLKLKKTSVKINHKIFFTTHSGLFLIKDENVIKLFSGGIFYGLQRYKNFLIFSFNGDGHGFGKICFVDLS